ncbi:MAG: hypothetical protein NTU53_15620 [Planctomycetota bacterium]|nr:hypothetical protein [Planctomycetota bacterium]
MTRLKHLLCLLALLWTLSGVANVADAEIDHVAKHAAIFTPPPRHVPPKGMPDGALLDNGDVGIVLARPPESQVFYHPIVRRDADRRVGGHNVAPVLR